MDTFARALKIAAKIVNEGILDKQLQVFWNFILREHFYSIACISITNYLIIYVQRVIEYIYSSLDISLSIFIQTIIYESYESYV